MEATIINKQIDTIKVAMNLMRITGDITEDGQKAMVLGLDGLKDVVNRTLKTTS